MIVDLKSEIDNLRSIVKQLKEQLEEQQSHRGSLVSSSSSSAKIKIAYASSGGFGMQNYNTGGSSSTTRSKYLNVARP